MEARALYREAIRVINRLERDKIKPKLKHNIREFFEIYKDATPEKKKVLLDEGREDIRLLSRIIAGPKEHVENIFKGFE